MEVLRTRLAGLVSGPALSAHPPAMRSARLVLQAEPGPSHRPTTPHWKLHPAVPRAWTSTCTRTTQGCRSANAVRRATLAWLSPVRMPKEVTRRATTTHANFPRICQRTLCWCCHNVQTTASTLQPSVRTRACFRANPASIPAPQRQRSRVHQTTTHRRHRIRAARLRVQVWHVEREGYLSAEVIGFARYECGYQIADIV